MKRRMHLRIFDGGAGVDEGTESNATFSFEQAEEIANARAHRAEQAALKSYFHQQGMTQEQVQQALNDYRQRQQSQQQDVSKLQADLTAAQAEVAQYENEKILSKKGVCVDDMDYVLFKVSALVDDKTNFKDAADKFLKENPKFINNADEDSKVYRVSTGAQAGGASGKENSNDFINNAIRRAARR